MNGTTDKKGWREPVKTAFSLRVRLRLRACVSLPLITTSIEPGNSELP